MLKEEGNSSDLVFDDLSSQYVAKTEDAIKYEWTAVVSESYLNQWGLHATLS